MISIAFGAAGLIIVLSVFNGFSNLITNLYDAFDPDLKITAVAGKTFNPSQLPIEKMLRDPGVANISFTLEDNALVKYRDRQALATIKGVDEQFVNVSKANRYLEDGRWLLSDGDKDFAVAGSGLAYMLDINTEDLFSIMNIYFPKKESDFKLIPEEAFVNLVIQPSGIFSIQQDFDTKYIFVPLRFARELTGEKEKISAVEIALKPGTDAGPAAERLQTLAGSTFLVRDRLAQHEFLDRIFNSEKPVIVLILGFIILISAFGIIGTLTMIIIEKKKDISIFSAMGCDPSKIRSIFFTEGLLLVTAGGFAGLVLGGAVCCLQQWFGLIRIGNADAFITDVYPVAMMASDFFLSFAVVIAVGIMVSSFASLKISSRALISPSAAG